MEWGVCMCFAVRLRSHRVGLPDTAGFGGCALPGWWMRYRLSTLLWLGGGSSHWLQSQPSACSSWLISAV